MTEIAIVGATLQALTTKQDAASALRIFTAIPPRYGVIPVEYDSVMFRAGEVAVYDEMWTSGLGQNDCMLEEGGIYVTENQRPTAGMTWERWYEGRNNWCPSRLDISRRMVRVARCRAPNYAHLWMVHPLALKAHGAFLCSDGPLEEYPLANQIIGRVVGIYRPEPG